MPAVTQKVRGSACPTAPPENDHRSPRGPKADADRRWRDLWEASITTCARALRGGWWPPRCLRRRLPELGAPRSQHPLGPLQAYRIYRDFNNRGFALLVEVAGDVRTYRDLTCSPGNYCQYKLSAVNEAGEGLASGVIPAIPPRLY